VFFFSKLFLLADFVKNGGVARLGTRAGALHAGSVACRGPRTVGGVDGDGDAVHIEMVLALCPNCSYP